MPALCRHNAGIRTGEGRAERDSCVGQRLQRHGHIQEQRANARVEKVGACNNKRWQAVTNGGQSVGVALSSAGSDSWRCAGDWVMGSRPLNAHSLGRALCVNTASASPATIGGDVSSFMAQVACSSAIYWALNRIPCSSFTDTPDSTDIQRIEARCHGSRPIDRMHGV